MKKELMEEFESGGWFGGGLAERALKLVKGFSMAEAKLVKRWTEEAGHGGLDPFGGFVDPCGWISCP